MSRALRPLSDLITEVQTLLGEPSSAFFTSDLLKTLFNQCLTRRVVALHNTYENWITETATADLVADQATYQLPEGIGRVVRVIIVTTDGYERVLDQERKNDGVWVGTAESSLEPMTYRLIDTHVELSPPPYSARTGGLKIEYEAYPDRMTDDGDKLPTAMGVGYEDLLVLDTAVAALDYESAQSGTDERAGLAASFLRRRAELEDAIALNSSERTLGRVFGRAFDWGG